MGIFYFRKLLSIKKFPINEEFFYRKLLYKKKFPINEEFPYRKMLSKKKFPLKRINSQYLVNLFLECPVLYRNRVSQIFLYF